jgi:hypothetical protein
MSRSAARVALAALLALTLTAAARDDKPTRVAIGKKGKAATAFVEHGRGTGTAFCIHPSGLFVTNEHVVHTAENGTVTLVLNPSLDTQRVLKGKVVRTDKASDLALVRVDGVKDLPSLVLGSIKDAAELADVVACGFPLGKELSPDRKEYPAVSVNAGTITALRRDKDKQLQFIQIDVALTYGNSGGPVLDDTGKVIGVVVSGVEGGRAGINQAIPVSVLERFLKTPDVAFAPSDLARADLEKPREFTARVVSFVPDAPEPSLKLILQAGEEEPRAFPMKKVDGQWVVTAPPVAKSGVARIELSARFGTGAVTGTVADAVFKVGDKPVRLSGVRRIELGAKPRVLLADGRTVLEGAVTGLGVVEIDVSGQKATFDFAKATRVTVEPPLEIVSVSATVVATVGGKEVARAEARIVVRDAATRAPADPSSVPITPPALETDKVVKKLPEVFSDMVVGGGGRYLIFHMPKLKKLAVFDVNEAKATKYISLSEDDIAFGAGLDCVVIGLKKSGKLERWSLSTFELEKTAPFDDIKVIVMGHGSNGPVVVNGQFLDLATFKPIPVKYAQGGWDPNLRPTVSADGTAFGVWGGVIRLYVLESGTLQRAEQAGGGHVLPSPDGQVAFTTKGVAGRTLNYTNPEDAKYGYCLPAVRGDYFLSIEPEQGGKGGGFTVYLRGLKQRVAKLENLNHGLFLDSGGGDTYHLYNRVYLIPDAKVIAVLPLSRDQVVLYKMDADAALEKSGQDYLLVASNPQPEVKAGATFTYPIKVKSKNPKVTYSLDSGPKGMTVSAEGVVTWEVPADTPVGNQDVILTVASGSGQEVFQTFTVRVVR